jgi:hypothetical protein
MSWGLHIVAQITLIDYNKTFICVIKHIKFVKLISLFNVIQMLKNIFTVDKCWWLTNQLQHNQSQRQNNKCIIEHSQYNWFNRSTNVTKLSYCHKSSPVSLYHLKIHEKIYSLHSVIMWSIWRQYTIKYIENKLSVNAVALSLSSLGTCFRHGIVL